MAIYDKIVSLGWKIHEVIAFLIQKKKKTKQTKQNLILKFIHRVDRFSLGLNYQIGP